jgi:hypothetical protein
MDGHSDELAVRDSADFRSFAVEAWAGRRAGGWPLSRFDISSRELRVRLSFPWFTTRSEQASAIHAVDVTRRLGDMCCIRFDDIRGNLSEVHVHPLYRRQQIIDERPGRADVQRDLRYTSAWTSMQCCWPRTATPMIPTPYRSGSTA